jgi:hypothetical protein
METRMIFNKALVLAFIFLLLSGCATPYQKLSYNGGYSEIPLNKDTYKVSFMGNAHLSADQVQNYLLRRCAEITLNKDYRYFAILSGGTYDNSSVYQTPATINSNTAGFGDINGFGNRSYFLSGFSNSYTTINPSRNYIINKFNSFVIIKLLKSVRGNSQYFDAKIILEKN